jgi:hypothetical protein
LLHVDSSIERDEWTSARDRLVGMLERHGSEPDLGDGDRAAHEAHETLARRLAAAGGYDRLVTAATMG